MPKIHLTFTTNYNKSLEHNNHLNIFIKKILSPRYSSTHQEDIWPLAIKQEELLFLYQINIQICNFQIFIKNKKNQSNLIITDNFSHMSNNLIV
jgi:hypothetical protein